jgi:hypothetical protein
MVDIGTPLIILIGGITTLMTHFPPRRFGRTALALSAVTTLILVALWVVRRVLGAKMVLAAPVPSFVPDLMIMVGALLMIGVSFRGIMLRNRRKQAAQQPQ